MTRLGGMSCHICPRGAGSIDANGSIVICITCKRGCHSLSCSSLTYRDNPKVKLARVRVCSECLEKDPLGYTDTPPRARITSGGMTKQYGRIQRRP